MSNVKISELGNAAALDGTEEVPVVQGGSTLKTTTQAIANRSASSASSINTQSDSYTLVASDVGKIIEMTKASANNLTLPQDSDAAIAIGTSGLVYQSGAGQVTFVAGTGATLLSEGSKINMVGQYGLATWIKVAANTFVISGDLTT